MEQTIEQIKSYLKILNPNITSVDDELVTFAIEEVLDRVSLYLNSDTIPTKLNRILAQIVNTGLKKCLKDIEISKEDNTAVDQVITSISDNGQSISYANEVTKYFTTTTDEELFSGFSTLISRYRRIKVVYPENNEE